MSLLKACLAKQGIKNTLTANDLRCLQVAYFVNSGSEANDMAMMMARLYTGNYDVLALRNAYHGLSEATMGVTAHSSWKCNVPQVCSYKHLAVMTS